MLGQFSIALFGDHFRLLKMGLALFLIVGLGWTHARFSIDRPEGYRAYIGAPSEHDGKRVLLPLWEVTGVGEGDTFYVSKSILDVPIVGESSGLNLGDTVTVIGHFRATDGAVIAEKRVVHPWRKAKGLLSIFALILACIFMPRFFYWSDGRVVVRG